MDEEVVLLLLFAEAVQTQSQSARALALGSPRVGQLARLLIHVSASFLSTRCQRFRNLWGDLMSSK